MMIPKRNCGGNLPIIKKSLSLKQIFRLIILLFSLSSFILLLIHHIQQQQEEDITHSRLLIDSQCEFPRIEDTLNIDSDFIFYGASIREDRGKCFPKNIKVSWSTEYTEKSRIAFPAKLAILVPDFDPSLIHKHPLDVGMSLITKKKYLCSDNKPGFVWIEDDVIFCNNTYSHLKLIMNYLRKLPETNPLVYIRVSFGFNGLVIRCTKYDEFLNSVILSYSAYGIDWSVASKLKGKTATYKYSLFAHPVGMSSTYLDLTEKLKRRDANVLKCFDININPHVPNEFYHSKCSGISLLSPCDEYHLLSEIETPPFPFDSSDLTIHSNEIVIESNSNCNQACENIKMICSQNGISRMNNMIRAGINVFPTNSDKRCIRSGTISHDSKAAPKIEDSICLTRVDQDPEFLDCNFANEYNGTRLCVCSSNT